MYSAPVTAPVSLSVTGRSTQYGANPPPCTRGRSHHAVRVADRPSLRLELASEELAEVPVVVQVLHRGLLHVDPEGPDVQAVDGFPQPGGQLHLVQPAPGPGEHARRDGLI